MEVGDALYPADAELEVEAKYNLPDRCLHIYDLDGGEARVDADDEMILRKAMEEYLESGKDKLLDFVTTNGAEYTTRSSRVSEWLVSTAKSRLMSRTVQAALGRASRANNIFDPGSDD